MDAALLAETAEDLYEHAPCGYLSTLPDGTIVKVNQTLLDWLGYDRSEILGRTFASLLTIGGRIYHETHYARLLEMHGRVNEIAFDFACKDDQRRSVLVTSVARMDASGKPAIYRSTIFDATDRRSYERELVLARKAAERAAQERADFLAMVSHEIRTPLTLAMGTADERLASASSTTEEREAWEVARRSNVRILRLVNSLLDFARIEAGQVHVQLRPAQLDVVTRDVVESFRQAFERAGLTLRVNIDALPQPVPVDREMWEKIVLNLVSNALKFTLAGEVEVSLRAFGDQIELVVRDTGTGIPPAELPHVFEKFHRVRDAQARTREGTGIGLALVDELLRMHGGTVSVTSDVGHGSTFTARIPAARPDVELAAPAETGVPVDIAPFVQETLQWSPPRGTPLLEHDTRPRIVFADDSADLRAFVATLLGSDYDVHGFADGRTALESARQLVPSLVIADVRMPGLDGHELVRALRADPATKLVPVILLSSGASEDARVSGLQQGADDYIVKPFSPRELRARVRTHIDLARLRTSAAHERERFRAAFEAAAVGMAIVDRTGRFLQVNRTFCQITGYTPDELLQLTPSDITHSADRARSMQLHRDLFDEKVPSIVYEKQYVRPDGAIVWVQNSAALVRDTDGTPMEAIRISEDITARKRVEVERTRLLELEQQARRQAESAARAKDEFLAMLGHELRNPLAPMVTALSLMRLRGQASREQEVLTRQVSHLSRLVDDLLDISRITRGIVELKKKPLELAPLVHEANEMVRPLFESRDQPVTLDVPAGLWIDADPARITQIVSNLITNASKYSDPGTPIHVRATATTSTITLRVRDQGVGIAPDMRERIFEMFTQQEQSLDRSRGGLGLGLAIVRNLVQLHGGRVYVESPGLGRGSEFIVELPRVQTKAEGPRAMLAGPQISLHPGMRILIVEDNEDAANMLAEALKLSGHHVTVAFDPATALEIASGSPPDVALIDVGLPVMDGYELATRLRALHPMRICVISGYGQENDHARSEAAGIDRHLVKPVDLQSVLRFVAGD